MPFVHDTGRAGYQRYLASPKPKAFVIAPDGAWASASGVEDPVREAIKYCSKGHQGCKLYAVDDKVICSN